MNNIKTTVFTMWLRSLLFVAILCAPSVGQSQNRAIAYDWFLASEPSYGLVSTLIGQPGNGSSDIKIRLAYTGATAGNYFKGVYNPATTYAAGERVWFTATGYSYFVALQSTTGNAPNPFADTPYWAKENGAEMIQNMGDGTWMRYTLGFNQDDLIRWGSIQRGTISQTTTTLGSANVNLSSSLGACATSIVITSVPATYSVTFGTGLSTLFDKVNLGSSSSSISILGASASPTFQNITLPTGQTLTRGDALKLENNSSNFNIAIVITYNSTTGAAYVAHINGVGSGTYTSWTAYKVALVHMTWDSAPTSVYNHSFVNTYNSGTGAASITSFVQLGTGTRATWTLKQGRTAPVTTASQGTEMQQDGGIYGLFVTGIYKGTMIRHNAFRRTEAVAWRYIITSGPNAGNEYVVDLHGRPIVLSGSSGTANIVINGVNYLATFNTLLATTASDFVTTHGATLAGLNVTVTALGTGLMFSGTGLTSASVSNVSGNLSGAYSATQELATVASNLSPTPDAGYEFIAFSIVSPNANSTNTRATLNYSSTATNTLSIGYLATVDVFTASVPIAGQGDSSGEIAWNFKKNGTGDSPVWLPDHNFDRVSFGRARTYTVDGVVYNLTNGSINPYAYQFQSFNSFTLAQAVSVYHPSQVPKMADLTTSHTFDKKGLLYDFNFTASQDWSLSSGYIHMISFPKSGSNLWFDKFLTDANQTFTWPGGTSVQNLASNQIGWKSALFYSLNSTYTDNQNFVLGSWWDDTSLWRIGQTGKGQDAVGYSAGPKLYPNGGAYIIPSGSTTRIKGRLYAGNKGTLVLN